MQASLIEGSCLRFGSASMFLAIACEPLDIVCGQNLMILALELSCLLYTSPSPRD